MKCFLKRLGKILCVNCQTPKSFCGLWKSSDIKLPYLYTMVMFFSVKASKAEHAVDMCWVGKNAVREIFSEVFDVCYAADDVFCFGLKRLEFWELRYCLKNKCGFVLHKFRHACSQRIAIAIGVDS